MRDVVIVEAVRTAIGKRKGSLAHTHPIDMLGPVQAAAITRAGLDPAEVGQVVGGASVLSTSDASSRRSSPSRRPRSTRTASDWTRPAPSASTTPPSPAP
jgi:hypothetical protein